MGRKGMGVGNPEDYVIEPYQIERKLAHLNPHKAGGPD